MSALGKEPAIRRKNEKEAASERLLPLVPLWLLAPLWFISLALPNLVYSGVSWYDTLHIVKWAAAGIPVGVAILAAGLRLAYYGRKRIDMRIDLFGTLWLALLARKIAAVDDSPPFAQRLGRRSRSAAALWPAARPSAQLPAARQPEAQQRRAASRASIACPRAAALPEPAPSEPAPTASPAAQAAAPIAIAWAAALPPKSIVAALPLKLRHPEFVVAQPPIARRRQRPSAVELALSPLHILCPPYLEAPRGFS